MAPAAASLSMPPPAPKIRKSAGGTRTEVPVPETLSYDEEPHVDGLWGKPVSTASVTNDGWSEDMSAILATQCYDEDPFAFQPTGGDSHSCAASNVGNGLQPTAAPSEKGSLSAAAAEIAMESAEAAKVAAAEGPAEAAAEGAADGSMLA